MRLFAVQKAAQDFSQTVVITGRDMVEFINGYQAVVKRLDAAFGDDSRSSSF